MPSPDRHFATAAIFTQSTGLTPNSGDAALYIKTDNKAYIKDSTGAELPVASIGGSAGATDNLVLRADGTGGATIQNSAIQIDDATTSTQNNVAIINADSQTNSSLVLTPKGTGALIAGPKPDGTATGGNARGARAVDLQRNRSANTQVASGDDSAICGGQNNSSTGTVSFVGSGINNLAASNRCAVVAGNQNQAGTNGGGNQNCFVGGGFLNAATASLSCIVGGDNNTANAASSSILGGTQGRADRSFMQAHAGGAFAANGDAQRARFVLRCKTTTNSAVEMALDGATTYLTIPSGKVMFMNIKVVGTKSDGSAVATYERQYAVKNVTGTSSEIYAAVVIGTDNAVGTSLAVATVDAGDYVSIKPTGVASETWRWVASVDAVEVAYGT